MLSAWCDVGHLQATICSRAGGRREGSARSMAQAKFVRTLAGGVAWLPSHLCVALRPLSRQRLFQPPRAALVASEGAKIGARCR